MSTTVGEEKKFNPRVGDGKTEAEFAEIMNNLNLPKPKKINEAVPANLRCGLIPPESMSGDPLPDVLVHGDSGTIYTIPEPSRAVLLSLGALAAFIRRR